MTKAERERLLDLRVKSKTGGTLTDEEQLFCREMWERFPDEYPKDSEVFKIAARTVNPFAEEG